MLLLLLFIIDRFVFHAMLLLVLCCSFVIAITELMRLYEHMIDVFQLYMTSTIFILPFAFFFSSDLAHRTPITRTRTVLPITVI